MLKNRFFYFFICQYKYCTISSINSLLHVSSTLVCCTKTCLLLCCHAWHKQHSVTAQCRIGLWVTSPCYNYNNCVAVAIKVFAAWKLDCLSPWRISCRRTMWRRQCRQGITVPYDIFVRRFTVSISNSTYANSLQKLFIAYNLNFAVWRLWIKQFPLFFIHD